MRRQAAVGPYQLRVLERAAAASPAAQSITLGSEVLASLDEGDAEADDGSLFDLYTFSGRAGQRVQIRLASDRFDTLLSLGRMLDGAFREIASNDDAGEGTDSALDLTLPTDGEYAVRAQALSTGGNGPYRLRLDAGR